MNCFFSSSLFNATIRIEERLNSYSLQDRIVAKRMEQTERRSNHWQCRIVWMLQIIEWKPRMNNVQSRTQLDRKIKVIFYFSFLFFLWRFSWSLALKYLKLLSLRSANYGGKHPFVFKPSKDETGNVFNLCLIVYWYQRDRTDSSADWKCLQQKKKKDKLYFVKRLIADEK